MSSSDLKVDGMREKQEVRKDRRPVKLVMLKLMEKKKDTESKFERMFGN